MLADNSMEIVLKMLFLAFNNTNIQFTKLGKPTWRSHTIAEALPITSQVELINKSELAKTALDENSMTFVMHVAALEVPIAILIHPSRNS